jgi:hypothetical protein
MKIEVLVRWAEIIPFSKENDPEGYLKRIVDGEESNNESIKPKIKYEFSPMILDVDDIARFNRSNSKDLTTLRMKDGEGYVIKFPYEEFVESYIEWTGYVIHSYVRENFEEGGDFNSPNKNGGGEFDVDEDDMIL